MQIQLSTPTLLKITWPYYSNEVEAGILERLSTVPGIEGRGRCYWCPVIQLERLMDLFWRASFDYAAMQVSDRAAGRCYDALVRMGAQLTIDAQGVVCAAGSNISPLVQSLIAERSQALKPFVLEAQNQPRRAQPERLIGPLTPDDAKWETWLNGVHNAAKKEEERKERYQMPRRRSSKPEQKGLGV